MRNCASFRIIAALVLGTAASAAVADTLLIDRVQRDRSMDRPTRGLTMDQVRARFGAPTAELGTVGGGSVHQPPITRWSYAGYTVYFEHDHVVNSVADRTTAYEQGPKPVE